MAESSSIAATHVAIIPSDTLVVSSSTPSLVTSSSMPGTSSLSVTDTKHKRAPSGNVDRMLNCYCCGRQYSPASLPIHLRSCPETRQQNYAVLPAEHRPPSPKPPTLAVPAGDATADVILAYNTEAKAICKQHMARCTSCDRTFEPDRLLTHMKGCRSTNNNNNTPKQEEKVSPQRSATRSVMGAGVERMINCYSCGRSYSYASLPIHAMQCPAARRTLYDSLPNELRPPLPKVPSLPFPTDETLLVDIQKYNDEANERYREAMATCPECDRRFEPDRILAHMRSHWSDQKMLDIQSSRPSSARASPSGHQRTRSVGVAGMGVGVERMLVCYLCGRHYGAASLPIHFSNYTIIDQSALYDASSYLYDAEQIGSCPATRKSLLSVLPIDLQPASPSPPSLPVPSDTTPLADIIKYNEMSNTIYRDHLPQCPESDCQRRFEPDRIMAHMRSHWSEQKIMEYTQQQSPRTPSAGSLSARGSPSGHHRSKSVGVAGMGVGVERMLVCFSCGRHYGAASLPIHAAQCPATRRILNDSLPLSIRPPLSKPPTLPFPNDSTPLVDIQKYNDEANERYRDAMATCPECDRRFEPDRVLAHMRSHWSEQKMLDMLATAVKAPMSPVPSSLGSPGHSRSRSFVSPLSHNRSKSDVKSPGGIERMLTCYSCGRSYSYASLPIHLGRCYETRKTLFDQLPSSLRPAVAPKAPDEPMPGPSSLLADVVKYNDSATAIYREYGMIPCAKCLRRFEPDRAPAHIRGCTAIASPKRPSSSSVTQSTRRLPSSSSSGSSSTLADTSASTAAPATAAPTAAATVLI